MKNLIIEATKEKIFSIITNTQSYNTSYINSRENFDKFMDFLLNFFKKIKLNSKILKKYLLMKVLENYQISEHL